MHFDSGTFRPFTLLTMVGFSSLTLSLVSASRRWSWQTTLDLFGSHLSRLIAMIQRFLSYSVSSNGKDTPPFSFRPNSVTTPNSNSNSNTKVTVLRLTLVTVNLRPATVSHNAAQIVRCMDDMVMDDGCHTKIVTLFPQLLLPCSFVVIWYSH